MNNLLTEVFLIKFKKNNFNYLYEKLLHFDDYNFSLDFKTTFILNYHKNYFLQEGKGNSIELISGIFYNKFKYDWSIK